MNETSYIWWDDGVLYQHAELDIDGRFVLDQHAELDIYNSSSLKQQSADRHVAQLNHINLILVGQPVFVLTP